MISFVSQAIDDETLLLCDIFSVLSVSPFISAVHSAPTVPPACVSLLLSCPTPQEQEFLQKQQQDLDGALKKIIQQHKVEISTIERDCLNHKQQLLRGRRWTMRGRRSDYLVLLHVLSEPSQFNHSSLC